MSNEKTIKTKRRRFRRNETALSTRKKNTFKKTHQTERKWRLHVEEDGGGGGPLVGPPPLGHPQQRRVPLHHLRPRLLRRLRRHRPRKPRRSLHQRNPTPIARYLLASLVLTCFKKCGLMLRLTFSNELICAIFACTRFSGRSLVRSV